MRERERGRDQERETKRERINVYKNFIRRKQLKCSSVNEWTKKQWCIYKMEYYVAERKKELLSLATVWMDLESIMLSETSQVVKERYHMISPVNGT